MALKPCPCGAVFDNVSVQQDSDRTKWAFSTCPVCGEWTIEFRADYTRGNKLQKRANAAWDAAPRNTAIS